MKLSEQGEEMLTDSIAFTAEQIVSFQHKIIDARNDDNHYLAECHQQDLNEFMNVHHLLVHLQNENSRAE